MNRLLLTVAASLSFAAAAHAESPDRSGQFAASIKSSTSRSQVLAELREAQRTGDILAAGEAGVSLYELSPAAYPARAMFAGKSREQVRAETLQAIRDGDIIQGELGLPQRELFPGRYMAGTGATRAKHAAAGSMQPLPSAE